MSTVITLIQAEEVVNQGILKGSPLSSRFDASQIAPNIAEGERRFLKTFINEEFFDDLIAEKNPTPSNYNPDLGLIVLAFPNQADYELLWTQHLFPYLSRTSYYESLDGIVIQVGSNGAFLNDTQFGTNVGIQGLKYMKDAALEWLNGRQPDIITFLCENEAEYPLFDRTGHCADCDNLKNKTGRNAGFVLRKKVNNGQQNFNKRHNHP